MTDQQSDSGAPVMLQRDGFGRNLYECASCGATLQGKTGAPTPGPHVCADVDACRRREQSR